MIVNKGLNLVATLLSTSDIKYIAYGTGTTAPSATDTALETPSAEARTAGIQALVTTNTTDDTYQVTATITCTTAAKAVTEVAIFDQASGGNLFARFTFAPINLEVGDSVQFTLKSVMARA